MDVLTVQLRSDGEVTLAQVVGEIDTATAGRLAQLLEPAFDSSCRHLVLDLAGVSFLDCAGLTVLLDMDALAKAMGASLLLAAPSRAVQRILAVTGLDARLAVHAGAVDAHGAVPRPRREIRHRSAESSGLQPT